jgi:hypothetical protein
MDKNIPENFSFDFQKTTLMSLLTLEASLLAMLQIQFEDGSKNQEEIDGKWDRFTKIAAARRIELAREYSMDGSDGV